MDSLRRVCRKDPNGAAARDSCSGRHLACRGAGHPARRKNRTSKNPGSSRVCSEKTGKRRGRKTTNGCNVTLPLASPEQTCDPGKTAHGFFHRLEICLNKRKRAVRDFGCATGSRVTLALGPFPFSRPALNPSFQAFSIDFKPFQVSFFYFTQPGSRGLGEGGLVLRSFGEGGSGAHILTHERKLSRTRRESGRKSGQPAH